MAQLQEQQPSSFVATTIGENRRYPPQQQRVRSDASLSPKLPLECLTACHSSRTRVSFADAMRIAARYPVRLLEARQKVTDDTVQFSATQRDAGDGAPGATAAIPYEWITVERFRNAFLHALPRRPGGLVRTWLFGIALPFRLNYPSR
jgi:hypothetical protein